MPRGAAIAATGMLVLLLLPFPAAPSTFRPAIPPDPGGIALLGLSGMQHRLIANGLFTRSDVGGQVWVLDQMMGVVAAVEGTTRRRDEAAQWSSLAATAWTQSQAAFDPAGLFFAETIPPPNPVVCINIETNSWALRAALALRDSPSGAGTDAGVRIPPLRDQLIALIGGNQYQGRPACNLEADRPFLHATALLALLDFRAREGGATVDAAIRNDLATILQSMDDVGFPQPGGLYSALVNARMLAVLNEATLVFNDPLFATARDRVFELLRTHAISRDAGLAIVNDLERRDGTLRPYGPTGHERQIWTAYALATHPTMADPALRRDLTDAYVGRYWSGPQAAFVSDGGGPYFEANALPVLLTGGPNVLESTTDLSTVGFVVPSEAGFVYPGPAVSPSLYGANAASSRFRLNSTVNGPMTVYLPVVEAGPFNLSLPASTFHPAPRLTRTEQGQPVAVPFTLIAGGSILRFDVPLPPGGTAFRLEASAPVAPEHADVVDTIRFSVRNHAPEALTLPTLQIDIDVTATQILAGRLNEGALADFQQNPLARSPQLPGPHLQLLFRNVVLPPRSLSQFEFSYTDKQAPSIEGVSLTRDAAGHDVLGPVGDDPVTVPLGVPVYVRATVRDNVAVHRVFLIFRLEDQEVQNVEMEPSPSDLYSALLPQAPRRGGGYVQVSAVDWAEPPQYQDSPQIRIQVQYALLSGGSLVLFVFSATLFVTSGVIYFKVRRRGRRALGSTKK